jgi:cytochrome c556
MRQRFGTLLAALCAAALLTSVAVAAITPEGHAAFQKRRDTMREMGRNLYRGIGRVVRGQDQYGPDTVVAAQNVARLAATIGVLFAAGSDDPESNMKPELLLADPAKIAGLIAGVEAAAAALVPAARSGDKAAIAAEFKRTNAACDACHSEYRKDD